MKNLFPFLFAALSLASCGDKTDDAKPAPSTPATVDMSVMVYLESAAATPVRAHVGLANTQAAAQAQNGTELSAEVGRSASQQGTVFALPKRTRGEKLYLFVYTSGAALTSGQSIKVRGYEASTDAESWNKSYSRASFTGQNSLNVLVQEVTVK